jgi:8-oxo-dGTP diphosphatase
MAQERFRAPLAVFIIFQKEDQIWLQRRANTGYRDGEYDVPSGHVEVGEAMSAAAVREAKEETGIDVLASDLVVKHVMYNNIDSTYINVFFLATKWGGEPSNAEPDKCDDARWFRIDELPQPIVPHVGLALKRIQENVFYSEEGWTK